MNNTWYRVRPSFTTDPKTRVAALQFRHPIGSGAKVNGWMRPSESEAAKAAAEESSSKPEKVFSLEEVEKHSSEQDAWIILNNKVYDVTSVLSWHPGGAHAISMYAGKASFEVTAEYASIHDSYANSKRDECLVGALDDEGIAQMQEDAKRTTKERAESEKARAEFALKKHTWSAATLVKRQELSHDTRLYTFAFPKGRDGKPGKLGLPICKHVQIGIHMKDAMVARSYTPTRPVLPNEDDGTFDLLIKTYFANEGPFPPGGTASNYLDVMTEGEELDIRGPTGEIEYLGDGKFDIEGEVKQFKRVSPVS